MWLPDLLKLEACFSFVGLVTSDCIHHEAQPTKLQKPSIDPWKRLK